MEAVRDGVEVVPNDAADAVGKTDGVEFKIPRFGARKKALELVVEVQQLRAQLDALGALEVAELERRRDALSSEISAEEQRRVEEREAHERQLELDRSEARKRTDQELEQLRKRAIEAHSEMDELRRQIVATEDLAMLQEAGIYDYRHPLDDSVAYKEQLAQLKDRIKSMTRVDGGAVHAVSHWTVNGSAAQGRKMVRDFSKLMLRAYNAEADTLVRGLKPYKLDASLTRLTKVRETIARLGQTMDIRISTEYHRARLLELELTADYVNKLAVEKEQEREEKARLREERKAQQELEREKARLDKERQHYANALRALESAESVDAGAVARLREQLSDVERKIEDVDYRAANIRAGYVYVISNIGAFGERMVKVGMTRRLEPLDRVRELGDASVPFRFDVHALFFSNDAVGIENAMHVRLADRRVNRVNLRREFFYATPEEAKAHLVDLAGELLQYEETAEAVEFRQSQVST